MKFDTNRDYVESVMRLNVANFDHNKQEQTTTTRDPRAQAWEEEQVIEAEQARRERKQKKKARRRESQMEQVPGYPPPHPQFHPAMGAYGAYPPYYPPQFMPPPMPGYSGYYPEPSQGRPRYGSQVPPECIPGYDAYASIPQDPRLPPIHEQPARKPTKDRNPEGRARSASEAPQKTQRSQLLLPPAEDAGKRRASDSAVDFADHTLLQAPRAPRIAVARSAKSEKRSRPETHRVDASTRTAAASSSVDKPRSQPSEISQRKPSKPVQKERKSRHQRQDRSAPVASTSQLPYTQPSPVITVHPPETTANLKADEAAKTINDALFLELDLMMAELNASFGHLRNSSGKSVDVEDLSKRIQDMVCSREPNSVKLDVDFGSPDTVLHVDVQMAFQAMRKVKDVGAREDFDFDTDEEEDY